MDGDQQLDDIVDKVLVLDSNPQLDDALIMRLIYDLATRIHKYETIASRYGLDGKQGLFDYLSEHPTVVLQAKKLRALFESDKAIEERVRMQFLVATESLIPAMQHLVGLPTTPVAARIDGFKQIQRGAGLDGAGAAAAAAAKGGGGTPFVLNINFRNGLTTKISGTAPLDPDEIPGPVEPERPSQLSLGAEPDEYDEEV